MTITIGSQIGPYEITGLLGKGGMGEVYRAQDTKLGRDVAIKLLPDAFATDPERTARFEREAKLLAALNHPNIASIYGFESGALVMELVEGDSPKGPMPLDEAWPIASQIIAALEYAHERGIVHRDLKPANIKLTPDGHVKLLDFGLAKAFTEPSGGPATNLSNSPTLTMATNVGVILGTAAYMAPEQAKSKSVDKRADIWSFGVVLYELLTGEQLFQSEDVSETLARVLTKQPDWDKVPMRVGTLLRACLEKDPKRRLRDIGDAERLLQSEMGKVVTGNARRPGFWKFAAAAFPIVLLPLAFVAWMHFRENPVEQRLLRTTILPPENTTFGFNFNNGLGLFALSPDGGKLVLSARGPEGNTQLWLRPLDSSTAQPLSGTDSATFPFWSPDSRFIGFFADGRLKKIDIAGGPPTTLADGMVGRGGTWSKDNVIVFAPSNNDPLYKVSADGGPVTPVTKLVIEDGPQRLPWFLPDGKHFLYRVQGAEETAVRIGSLDSIEPKIVGPARSNAVYAAGYLFFLRGFTLMAERFDAKTLSVLGEAVPIADNLSNGLAAGFFSVSDTGLLVYQSSKRPGPLESQARRTLAWVSREGKALETLRNPGEIADIEFSPDRTKFAYTLWGAAPENRDIWIYDIARQLPSRFTFDPNVERFPIWMPNGKSIICISNKRGRPDLYRKPTDLTGVEELLWESNGAKRAGAPTSVSKNGQFALVNGYSPSGKAGTHIWTLPLTTDGSGQRPTLTVFLDSGSFTETDGKFSPDGHWVAYSSDESRRYEIYVTAFPGPSGKRQISIDGGTYPRWSADGKEIFYVDLNATLQSAEIIDKGGTIEVGKIRPIIRGFVNQRGYLFDVSKDGSRFLTDLITSVIQPPKVCFSEPLTLISTWPALLKK